MQTTGLILSILSTLLHITSAQIVNGNYVAFSANSTAPREGYATYRAADRTPNETHAVDFNRDNTITSGKNWTWTLKISNVAMPNNTGFDIGNQSVLDYPGAHVAFTTYDFSWPQGGDLNQAVGKGENPDSPISDNNPSCLYMISIQFPPNVSEKYDASSSDCTSALGEECVDAIVSNIRGSGCESGNFPNYFYFQDECADSWGAQTSGGWAVQAFPFGNASAPSNQTSIQSGGTFAWTLSAPYAGGNATAFEAEKERLHVIGMATRGQNQLLCNRVAESGAAASLMSGRVGWVGLCSLVVCFWAALTSM